LLILHLELSCVYVRTLHQNRIFLVPLSSLLQKLPNLVLIMLIALLAYQFALFSWLLLPVEQSTVKWVAPKKSLENSGNNMATVSINTQSFFGEISKPAVVPSKKKSPSIVRKTKLNLTLVGVVAASEPSSSSAIIANKGKQDSYFINSKIDGTSASVYEIYEDRIILDEKGVYQVLMLDGLGEVDNQQIQQSVKKVPNTRTNGSTNVDLNRSELLKDPSKLTNYINISPVRENGEIKGYRLNPGKDPALFEQAGLEKGDLAIELNGVDLTDIGESMSLLKEFPTMTDISLTVDREGQLYDLYLSIP